MAKELLQHFCRAAVDGGGSDQLHFLAPPSSMPSAPCHEPRHVIVGNLGEPLVLAKETDEPFQIGPGLFVTSVMLANLRPIAPRRGVDGKISGAFAACLEDMLRLLTFCPLYGFRLPPTPAARRAVKSITPELEIEVPERRRLRLGRALVRQLSWPIQRLARRRDPG